MALLVVVAAALSILPTPCELTALPPATSSRSCSDNSAGFTSFTSCFASFSIFSIFLVFLLMVFLLLENVSFVNSGAPLKHPNQLPSPYKVQTNEKRGHKGCGTQSPTSLDRFTLSP